jgi:protein-tyrosine phosphatase
MAAFVDLHCHWVAGIDDGARDSAESIAMLSGLYGLGFEHVVATPHMRPGLFDNDRVALTQAYLGMLPKLEGTAPLPLVSLASEHFFDGTVVGRIRDGQGLPYLPARDAEGPRTSGPILVEFSDLAPAAPILRQLFRLQADGYTPVIAHPERYRAAWARPELVVEWVEAGCLALLDICALIGKYGQRPQQTALRLLELGAYDAACSDAHRPQDIPLVAEALRELQRLFGQAEVDLLLGAGPRAILHGRKLAP